MPAKKYIVYLDADERQQLLDMTSKGKIGARKTSTNFAEADDGWVGSIKKLSRL